MSKTESKTSTAAGDYASSESRTNDTRMEMGPADIVAEHGHEHK